MNDSFHESFILVDCWSYLDWISTSEPQSSGVVW